MGLALGRLAIIYSIKIVGNKSKVFLRSLEDANACGKVEPRAVRYRTRILGPLLHGFSQRITSTWEAMPFPPGGLLKIPCTPYPRPT
jgi:hypothetical protein